MKKKEKAIVFLFFRIFYTNLLTNIYGYFLAFVTNTAIEYRHLWVNYAAKSKKISLGIFWSSDTQTFNLALANLNLTLQENNQIKWQLQTTDVNNFKLFCQSNKLH